MGCNLRRRPAGLKSQLRQHQLSEEQTCWGLALPLGGYALLIRYRTCPVSATWKNAQAAMGSCVPVCQQTFLLSLHESFLCFPLSHWPPYSLLWALEGRVCSLCSISSMQQPLDKHVSSDSSLGTGPGVQRQEEWKKVLHSAAYTLVGKKYGCYSAVNVINVCTKCQSNALQGKGRPRRVDWDVQKGHLRTSEVCCLVKMVP